MVAAIDGHAAVVRVLLRAGASMGLRDISGRTALQMAQRKKHTAVIAEFRAHEAEAAAKADAAMATLLAEEEDEQKAASAATA